MTFSSGIFEDDCGGPEPNGGSYITRGWYKNTGTSTGGAIDTGLVNVYHMNFLPNVSAVPPILNVAAGITAPIDGANVTITTGAGDDGRWEAIGN